MQAKRLPTGPPKPPMNRTNGPQEPSRKPLGTVSMKHPVSECSREGPMCFPYCKYHAFGIGHVISGGSLLAPLWLPFWLLWALSPLQKSEKNPSGQHQKTGRKKEPKSVKSETPEVSKRVSPSWGNLAERTTWGVSGCKGHPTTVPALPQTLFSTILGTKTMQDMLLQNFYSDHRSKKMNVTGHM